MTKPEITCSKKVNLLAYHEPLGKKCKSKPNNDYNTANLILRAQPKRIQICTGSDLRNMCPPKICPPVVKKHPFRALFRLGLKSAIAAALVYQSIQAGIWGSADDTQKLYTSACKVIKPRYTEPKVVISRFNSNACESERELFPFVSKKDPYGCEDPFYNHEEQQECFRKYWNKAVMFIFTGLTHLPRVMMNFTKSSENYVMGNLKNVETPNKTCPVFITPKYK